MIIDAIHVYSVEDWGSDAVEYARLGLRHATLSDSYIIEKGWGFDVPDDLVALFYGQYLTDQYYEMSLPERDIVLKIRLNPNLAVGESVSSLRNNLYKLISHSRTSQVELRLMLVDDVVAFIRGRVKKIEGDIFGSDTLVQMTIECKNPMFQSDTIELSSTPAVESPKPVLTITDSVSNAPHGFRMNIIFTGTVANQFTINGLGLSSGNPTISPFRINRTVGNPFVSGDQLWFSSEKEDKYLFLIRGGTVTSIVDSIPANQVWPLLFPGENKFSWSSNSFNIDTLTHRYTYWGL